MKPMTQKTDNSSQNQPKQGSQAFTLPEDLADSLEQKVCLEKEYWQTSPLSLFSSQVSQSQGISPEPAESAEGIHSPQKPESRTQNEESSSETGKTPAKRLDQKQLVLLVLAGSRAYGRNTEESDLDLRGIYLPSPSQILLEQKEETLEFAGQEDLVLFSLAKYFRLAAAGNPNVLEWLFVKPEHVLYADQAGKALLENRELFLSKRMVDAYLGYACSSWKQLGRMMEQADLSTRSEKTELHKIEKHTSHIERLLTQLDQALKTGTFSTWNPEWIPPFRLEEKSGVQSGPVSNESGRNDFFFSAGGNKLHLNPEYLSRLQTLNEEIIAACKTSRLPEKADQKKLDQLRLSIMEDYMEKALRPASTIEACALQRIRAKQNKTE